MKNKRYHNERGVTLIELMVVSALGLILILSIGTYFISVKTNLQTIRAQQLLSRKARITLEILHRQTEMLGYTGCLGRNGIFYLHNSTAERAFQSVGYNEPLKYDLIGGSHRLILEGLSPLTIGKPGQSGTYPHELPLMSAPNQAFAYYTECEAKMDNTASYADLTQDYLTSFVLLTEGLDNDGESSDSSGRLYIYNHTLAGDVTNTTDRELLVSGVQAFKVEIGLAKEEDSDYLEEYIDLKEFNAMANKPYRRIRSVKYILEVKDQTGQLTGSQEVIQLSRVAALKNAWWQAE